MEKPIELIFGEWGAGLINIALAESLFEKGESDTYEITSLLNSGYTKADLAGQIEICYVAIALLSRIHICQKHLILARNQLSAFEEKVIKEKAIRLIPNLHAMNIWLAMLEGCVTKAKEWIQKEAPNELQEFYVLNRYQYLMKVRVYLALAQYHDAMNLVERLSVYFKEYQRTYMDMENEILKAILLYRMNMKQWKDTLINVLKRMEEYHFIYLIAKEGAAIWPLIAELDFDSNEIGISPSFAMQLKQSIYEMAVSYPNYLKYEPQSVDELTEMEKRILQLHGQGMDSKKICENCEITYNTLKFHNKNIYRKLGVKSKQEAVKKLSELNMFKE